MSTPTTHTCPGCQVTLPALDGPTHAYIGASAECWAVYTALTAAQQSPVAPTPFAPLIVDAYAAQHPGVPSPQSVQSVAVHLITLHGVLERNVPPQKAVWLRQRSLRAKFGPKHDRFHWLRPPDLAGSTTIADVAAADSAQERARTADAFVHDVWHRWAAVHAPTIAAWYDTFVVVD